MEFIILALLAFGNGYQFQKTYEHCKANNFEGEICKVHKDIQKRLEEKKK